MLNWLISLKPFILIVAAIPTGLFVRTVGQWFIDWARAPTDEARKQRQKRDTLMALVNTIGNAKQYCQQMSDYLSGMSLGSDETSESDGPQQKGVIIPTFNLDLEILERNAVEVYSLLAEDKAQDVMTTRLELAHVRRRVDTVADMMFVSGHTEDLTPLQAQYLGGTLKLLETTITRCDNTREMLDLEKNDLAESPPKNRRPVLILIGLLVLVTLLVFVASLPSEAAATAKKDSVTVTEREAKGQDIAAPEPESTSLFSLEVFGFVVAITALWLAWYAFRSGNHVLLNVEDCSCGGTESVHENSGQFFHRFGLLIKNRGICLHSPSVALNFRAKEGGGRFSLPLKRKAPRDGPVDEFAKGMIAEFHLKSYELDKGDLGFLRNLEDPAKQDACLIVYSQGYSAKALRVAGLWDRLKSKWNGVAFKFNSMFDREVGKNPEGLPVVKTYTILPTFVVLGFPLDGFLRAMRKEADKDRDAHEDGSVKPNVNVREIS